MKDWTIMVYLGADNNLGQEMIWALKDIYQTDPGDRIKVVALFDGGGRPRRFDPQKDRDEMKELPKARGANGGQKPPADVPPGGDGAVLIASDETPTQSGASVDSIEKTLKSFILDTIKDDENLAQHYMLILSGHGSGVIGEFLPAQKRLFGLTIPTLKSVLRAVKAKLDDREGSKKIDILGLDACEMSMTEIAYEVGEQVDYVIGAEGFQPNTGWPYDRVIRLFSDPKISKNPASVCENIVKSNIQFYLDYTTADLSVDTSALDVSSESKKLSGLKAALSKFTAAMEVKEETEEEAKARLKMQMDDSDKEKLDTELERRKKDSGFSDKDLVDAIVLARREAQGYKNEQFVDLWDFCDLLIRRLKHLEQVLGFGPTTGESEEARDLRTRLTRIGKVKDACGQIQDAIAPEEDSGKKGLVIASAYAGAAFQHSHGVSIYFPWANLTDAAGIPDVDHYRLLEFAKDTAWDEFIRLFHFATIRDFRRKDVKLSPTRLSLLNRRSGLFTGVPGHKDPEISTHDRDPEISTHDRTNVGAVRIAAMKNPPIEWRQYKF
jgi:hypothetical protein